MKNRMREICTSGSVRGGGGNVPTYSAEGQVNRGVAAIPGQPLEAVIAVNLQHTLEGRQVLCRARDAVILGIHIRRRWMAFAAPGPIVHRVAPQTPRFRPATTGIEHRQRRIVGKQLVRCQHGANDQLIQRRQPPAGSSHPITQGGSVQCHPLACQHLRLAIQREAITEFAHHHMHDQRLGRHAAINRPLGCRRHRENTVAAVAYVARATRDAHPQLCRCDVELLGAQLTHHPQ
jgi:hypothetical protein